MHLIKNQDLINKSNTDEVSSLNSFEELMKNGYLEMGTINLEIAQESVQAEEEAHDTIEHNLHR